MSSLVTNPTSQFINPFFGIAAENAKIFIGKANTDATLPENRQQVYLMQWTDGATVNKVPLTQPLETNSAGVIVYQGLPVTPWVDGAYSITIVGFDGAQLYTSFYIDDPTYWLRLDLATEPLKTADGLHYDPDDDHGVNMVAGAAPILSPCFEGEPTAPTPPTGDSSTRIATTEFVTEEVQKVGDSGPLGTHSWYVGATPPPYAVMMDGSQLSKTTYAALYAIIGDSVATANGLVPDSASFYIPDLRSRYVRGADNGASRSNYALMLKYYSDLFKSHTHVVTKYTLRNLTQDGDSDGTFIKFNGPGDAGAVPTDFIDSTGDSETMPMSVPMLPILWAIGASATVSASVYAWYERPDYAAARPAIHHYHESTGEYLASSPARPSPLEPGVWLTPAYATQKTPPPPRTGHVLAFREGTWMHDAELFQLREQAKEDARLSQERRNTVLMENASKRKAINEWMKQSGAPFTLDDLEEL
ncbi:phage tailspike protein [Leclercia adecarboxylata]|uniref:phage tailspike protein n=1 Tax=Leclercia adecarboxylata TaxID=83655 RepID=UPI002029CFC8|nr:phage tailspike protein [Leclercia adecarboxylata]URO00948.1 phage tailspike protein [Leclercia adecarboxylata]